MTYMLLRGRPVTKGRPRLTRGRRGGKRRVYTPHNTLQFEAAVREAWLTQNPGAAPIVGPVAMTVIVGSDWTEVWVEPLESGARPKHVQGDIDNYVKSVSDGLNGAAYVDDKQVHMVTAFFSRETLEVADESAKDVS